MCRRLLALILLFNSSLLAAKQPYSGDILGRDLLMSGLGWVGHVGLVTGDKEGVRSSTVIDVHNEPVVIQLGTVEEFKTRTAYWGSRYGVGDYAIGTHSVLDAAHQQRYWCPKYTKSSWFTVGSKDQCGVWRCDTFVAWSFDQAGYHEPINHYFMMPLVVYKSFPYANDDKTSSAETIHPPLLPSIDSDFSKLNAAELNALSFEAFTQLADIPRELTTPSHTQMEWRFANDPEVNEVKRGIFIDRMALSDEKNILPRLFNLYEKTPSGEVQDRIIQATLVYYQQHKTAVQASSDFETLKSFYFQLLPQKLAIQNVDPVVRGFIEVHSSADILAQQTLIQQQLKSLTPTLSLGLQMTLALKSQSLEKRYIPAVIQLLKKNPSAELDDLFFGLTAERFAEFKALQSINHIKEYVSLVANKYQNTSKKPMHDPYSFVAKNSFHALLKHIQ